MENPGLRDYNLERGEFKERRDNLSQRMEENKDSGRKISAYLTSTVSLKFLSNWTFQLIKFDGYKTATFLPRLQF